jgi:hypothetical protein
MADDKKAPPSDSRPNPDKLPINNPQVDVTVNPGKGESGNSDYVKKVKKALDGEVRKTIADNHDAGSKKQLEKVKETIKRAADQIDPNKVANVKVKVKGDAGGTPIDDTTSEPTKKG